LRRRFFKLRHRAGVRKQDGRYVPGVGLPEEVGGYDLVADDMVS
jgi:hypothetical protein